jgi:photosystem II stability/assembly factor-like uncharacterized protein
MRSCRPVVLALSLLAGTLTLAAAESPSPAPIPPGLAAIDPKLFQDLRWRLLGPFRGGRALTITGVPGEPAHYYFGAVGGGVWESLDAGRTWKPILDEPVGGKLPAASIGAIAVAPSAPRVLYVGTGEADMRSDIAYGDGMYKSSDGGKSWSFLGLEDSHQIGKVLVHPADPDTVYVAALGHAYGPNAERGVFRSRDGGATWKRVLFRDENTGAIDLAFEPGNPNVLFAALWQTRRAPWSIYPASSGPGSGLYRSSDGGETWTQVIGHGFPAQVGRIGVTFARSDPKRVYALVDALKAEEGGLYRSDDGGATWTHSAPDRRIWGRGWYFGGVTVEPQDPDTVYVCNTALYRSTDGGKTFVPIQGAPGGDDYHEMWIDPENPARRALAVDQGAVVSHNGGATWSSWYNQATGQFYHVVTDNRFPYWVYGAQQDSGAAGVPSRTTTRDGINMMQFREVTAGGEAGNIAPDPNDPEIVYGGNVDRLDLRTEQTRSIDPTLGYPDNYRAEWTQPLAFSPRDPKVLYFARQVLFRTADGGEHWTRISGDLTRPQPNVPPNLDPPTAEQSAPLGDRRAVIYAIAPSPIAAKSLWVGTDDGLIWRTDDEGGNWKDVTPAGLAPWSKVGILEAGHFDLETAYAAIDRHRVDDYKPYLYRTHDGGKSWRNVVSGIPDGAFLNAVREDPVRRGQLYAATERGVYVSFDDGERWQPLQNGLPMSSVRDLVVQGNDLVIATHGRAFWVLDDVSALRQLEPAIALNVAVLFRPATAIRLRPAGFTGTPLPQDEPRAANPPLGAVIDYYLKNAAKASITLRILDAQGAEVRRYKSDALPKPPDPARLAIAPSWVRPPSTLSTEAGMHRFVWPLRYAAPKELSDGNSWADGVWAPPGRYAVELTIGDLRLTQPLAIEKDPRVNLPQEAFQAQFDLIKKIEAALVDAGKLEEELTAFEKQFAAPSVAKKGAAKKGASAKGNEALRQGLLAITGGKSTGFGIPTPPTPRPSLRSVQEDLNALTGLDDADAAPSPDILSGYEQARATLDGLWAAWAKLKGAAARAGMTVPAAKPAP